jgi:hypothetical protein
MHASVSFISSIGTGRCSYLPGIQDLASFNKRYSPIKYEVGIFSEDIPGRLIERLFQIMINKFGVNNKTLRSISDIREWVTSS